MTVYSYVAEAPGIVGAARYDVLPYNEDTPLDVPIEIRVGSANRPADQSDSYVICAWLTDHGTVGHSCALINRGNDSTTSYSISALQTRGTIMPRKAVPGWQAELIAYCASGLYEIKEVR